MRKPFIAVALTIAMTVASCMPITAAEVPGEDSTEVTAAVDSVDETDSGDTEAEETEPDAEMTEETISDEAEEADPESDDTADEAVAEDTEDGEEQTDDTEAVDVASEESDADEPDSGETDAVEEAEEAVPDDATEEAADEAVTGEDAAEGTEIEETVADEEVTEEAMTAEEGATQAQATAGETGEEQVIVYTPETQTFTFDGGESPDELFAAYAAEEMDIPGEFTDLRSGRTVKAGSRLTGNDKLFYDLICDKLPSIASGDTAETTFDFTLGDLGLEQTSWTAQELGVSAIIADGAITQEAVDAVYAKTACDSGKIMKAIMADQPYLLYWFDKTAGVGYSSHRISAHGSGGVYSIEAVGSITFSFAVEPEYAAGKYTVDTSKGQAVQSAAGNAANIVSKYAGNQDYDILAGYKSDICELVSYNDDAAAGNFEYEYGNPWQLIWVFDGDPDTGVVCEGYSKAFKYLCDRTEFSADIDCRLVSGTMSVGTDSGPHMWNIVSMDDDLNYLVDVTNCDSGSVGADDKLFLVGTDGSPETGYTFNLDNGSTIIYTYDSDMVDVWGTENLALNSAKYCIHDFGDWTVTKEATCKETGSRERVCSKCGVKVTEEIPMTSHSYGDWIVTKEPSCTEAGSREKVCDNCGDKVTEEIPMTDHTWSEEYTTDKEATCTETGSESIHCTVCGAIKEGTSREIPVTDHTWSAEYKTDKEATCTETGSESIHCSVCGATKEGSSKEIPATGHKWNSTYTVDETATTTKDGSKSIHCSVCDEIQEGSQKTIKHVGRLTISGIAAKTYNGKAQTQSVVVKDGSTALKNGTDYTVTYTDNINAGTAKVKIAGKGNYTGTVTKTFAIKQIANKITAKNFVKTYSAKAQSFALGAKISSGTPRYSSNTKSVTVSKAGKVTIKAKYIGKATITITAPGNKNYTETAKKITITVNPPKTALTSVKNSASKKMTVKWKKSAVVTGYQIQYATPKNFTKAKTVTITKKATVAKTIAKLTKGKKYYVRIRTYKTVSKVKLYSAWSAAKAVKISK